MFLVWSLKVFCFSLLIDVFPGIALALAVLVMGYARVIYQVVVHTIWISIFCLADKSSSKYFLWSLSGIYFLCSICLCSIFAIFIIQWILMQHKGAVKNVLLTLLTYSVLEGNFLLLRTCHLPYGGKNQTTLAWYSCPVAFRLVRPRPLDLLLM